MFSRKAEKVLFCNYCDFLWPQPGPAPREGPACLGSCCHHPSHCPAPSVPTQGRLLPVSSRGGSSSPQQPSRPPLGDSATPGCATSGSELCSVPTGTARGPSIPHPRGGHSTGILLEFAHRSPSCNRGTEPCPVLPSGHWREERACCLPGPWPPTVTWAPVPLFRKSPCVTGCLHSCLPWTLGGSAWRVALAVGAAALPTAPLTPHPSARAQGPQKGSCGLGHTGLAWLRGPPVAGLGETSSAQDHRGPAAGGQDSVRGPALPALGLSVCPRAVLSHSPRHVSATTPGHHLARRMPPRASRAAVCGVVPPTPGAGSVHPPLSSTHSLGRFFADF